ncbi:Autophagy protein 22 [Neophaeococcomyces mojaviensis]|uniref:Autophagy protein 22 n=1 Tax=Neophaeococcomyces mojaviensis TaxID=3383035 RepID=A0ACC3A5J6_9EURO|nr:Autophagy protein 22 [Knufia sp. JES_112]
MNPLISPTPSVEGDDEQSDSYRGEDDDDDDEDDSLIFFAEERGMVSQKHEDEDVRPTSQKELAGWYSYGWAAEVFAICAMGSFLPMTLEQLARDQGVLLSDRHTPCRTALPSSPNNPVHSLYASGRKELPACVIRIGHAEINTASFAMYTFSISVLVQSLLIVSMSAAADHGRFRKTFLITLAVCGGVALILFVFVVPQLYLLGALLAIISNTCFGASFVLLNSYIPVFVRYHPAIQELRLNAEETNRLLDDDDGRHYNEVDTSLSSLLPDDVPDDTRPIAPTPAAVSEEMKLATKISSNGIGIGYIAGLLVQVGLIFVVAATGSTTFSLRIALAIIGLWWLIFSIPTAMWLRPRPGPPLPSHLSGWLGYITFAWKALFKTVRQARKLKDIMIFLAAWFLLSDSIATVSGTAILFAKTNLGMKVEALALISVIGTVAGVFGAFYWSTFSRLLGLSASQTIITCVCLFELIPLYGLLGFIPAVQRLGYLGLQQPLEMYFLGAIYGFVLGGISSYCRAFFGELIPPGFEASFYALYAITDKGSSVFGPAIVGAITDRYGDIRPSFVFLAILIFLPLPLLMLIDVDRGKRDAAAMAVELEGKENTREVLSHNVPTIRLSEDADA